MNGKCLSVHGCYTFFPLQGSSMPAWTNAGTAAYHSLTIALRRSFSGFLRLQLCVVALDRSRIRR
jgi:hypothetical protein